MNRRDQELLDKATAGADHQTSSHAVQMINVAVVNVVTIPR